jgi:CheY-like chemotaxis protein
MTQGRPVILAVDDNRAICEAIRSLFEEGPFLVEAVPGAADARTYLSEKSHDVAVMLLDWEMPGESGLDLLKFVKSQNAFRLLPVIMLTGRTDPADVDAGIAAGALYYVTKPFDPRALKKLVEAALHDFDTVRTKEHVIWPRSQCREVLFEFRTIEEAGKVAAFLAIHCPDPDAARLGLHELLINAVEHGNLGISHEEKTELVREGTLPEEIRRRLSDVRYAARAASVRMIVEKTSVSFEIRDQGEGFEYTKFLSLSADRAFLHHGRGIAIARNLCFDTLDYTPPGNHVRAVVSRK